jgi:mannosyltransferase OCH1-like enzyme
VLYKYGGFYLDLKYECTNGFHLSTLLSNFTESDEIFVLDINRTSLYTELIASKPNNMIFLHCINHIVKNVHEKFYGNSDLDITGPGVLSSSVSENKKKNIELNHICINYNKFILWKGVPILKVFTDYSKIVENNKLQPKTHYQYWRDRELYV